MKRAVTRLTIIAAGAAIVCGLSLAGIATGKANHRPGHRAPFSGSGHSSYKSTGQACFRAGWKGSGTWNTDYKITSPGINGQGTVTTTEKDASSYSWHVGELASGAFCNLELLRFPGSKPSGGATWNLGLTKINADGQYEYTAPDQAPVSTNCNQSATDNVRKQQLAGLMTVKRKGSAIVFVMSTSMPSDSCGAYSGPGTSVPGGKVGPFMVSDSVAVPRTVFEEHGEVKIMISSASKNGPKPNCGVKPDPPATVTCSQSGAWQGTLTLWQGRHSHG